MIRNRNAIRLLCLFCLLVYPAINANLEAQTIIGQRNDSVSHSLIRHQLGFDIRPGYIVSTHSFLQGDNMQQKKIDQSLSFHLKYAFRFSKESNLGRLFPHTYQGIGVSYQTLVPLNWEIRCRYTLFRGHVSRNCRPVYRSITNGTSELLLAGGNMTNYPIRKTC